MAIESTDRPVGQRFSHVYLRPTELLQDSLRARRRLAALLFSMKDTDGLGSQLVAELGVDVVWGYQTVLWKETIARFEAHDFLDLITLAPLDQVPAEVATVKGRYDAVAACTFGRLDQTGLRKSDLQGEARVTLEGSGVRYWELRFRPAAKGTEVAFSRVQTLWGPMGGEGVMDAVRACAT